MKFLQILVHDVTDRLQSDIASKSLNELKTESKLV